MNASSSKQIDFTFNRNSLYREDSVTDLSVGSIRRLKPIQPDGTEDKERATIYVANSQLNSPQGLVPLQARLKATSLDQAMEEFPGAMQHALNEMVERMKKLQEQQKAAQQKGQSRIITPGR